MAKVVGTVDFPALKYSEPFDEQEKAFAVLEAKNAAAKREGKLVGRMLSFSVADGYAHYIIKSDRPLQLEFVPFLDAYSIPDWQISGLNLKAIKQLLQAQDSLDSLFGRD